MAEKQVTATKRYTLKRAPKHVDRKIGNKTGSFGEIEILSLQNLESQGYF